uniref:Uncharacterized protein n=1 Tax=Meloidogyne enterolobii TaxID=390850 RepID=A0A6V7XGQ2_MELEN|nr:unnamed protein product [Meloidogyne enterolobii]
MNPKIIFIFLLIILVFYSNQVDGKGGKKPGKKPQPTCTGTKQACSSRLPCCDNKQKCDNGGNPSNGPICH